MNAILGEPRHVQGTQGRANSEKSRAFLIELKPSRFAFAQNRLGASSYSTV